MANLQSNMRLRKGRVILLITGACILGGAGLLIYENFNPIHFRSNSPSIELGESFDPKANIRYVFMGTPDDVQISGYVNGLIPDTYEVDYLYKGKTWTIHVQVADTKAPSLVLKNVNAGLNEEVDAESFIESCSDASRFTVSIVDPEALRYSTGSRTVQIKATDEFGNSVTRNAKLTRYDDTIPPISKDTPSRRKFIAGEEFSSQIFNFTTGNEEDYRIETETDDLDMNTPGSYTVRYRFWDQDGHMTTFTETIEVIEAQDSADQDHSQNESDLAAQEDESENNEQSEETDNRSEGE